MFQTTNQLGFDSLHISASTLGFDRFRDDLMIKHKKFMTVAIHQPSLYGSTRDGLPGIPAVAFWKIHRNPHWNKTLTGSVWAEARHSVALAIDPFSSRFINGFPGKMIYEFAGFSI